MDNLCTSLVVKTALKGISGQHGQAQASALEGAALDTIRATAMLPRTERWGVSETTNYAAIRGQVDIARGISVESVKIGGYSFQCCKAGG